MVTALSLPPTGACCTQQKTNYANGHCALASGKLEPHLVMWRVDEFAQWRRRPHDIKRLPGGDTLVVANGGLIQQPIQGRAKF